MRIFNNLIGFILYIFRVRTFKPKNYFSNKRVAVIGAANSALDKELGTYIDDFDFVIRINKALITYNPENEKFIGRKADILIHNFHENLDDGGGGPIDWSVFDKFNLRYLVQAKSDILGKRNVHNYYKKYLLSSRLVFISSGLFYNNIKGMFGEFFPTRGFLAIYMALFSNAKEVYLTGFTFFKTDYADGYRDNIKSVNKTLHHIECQGIHNIELEYQNFKKILIRARCQKIIVDSALYKILKSDKDIEFQREIMEKIYLVSL